MAIHDLGQLGYEGAFPTMNRERLRRAAAFARPGQRIARRTCANGGCDFTPEKSIVIDGPNGPVSFPVPESLQRPFAPDPKDDTRRYRPLASMVGQVMSVPGLAAVSADDPESDVMIRATNLSSVVAVILTKVEPKDRKTALAMLGGSIETGPQFAESVLGIAKRMPGGLGILDAIRFSLALHFLIGIGDYRLGRNSVHATAYRQCVKVYRDGEKESDAKKQGQKLGSVAVTDSSKTPYTLVSRAGLSGLGNWFTDAASAVGNAIKKGAVAVADSVKVVGRGVQAGLQAAANWVSETFCKGFKTILPDVIANILCIVFGKGLELFVRTINTIIEVVIQIVDGLKDFAIALVSGDLMGAAKALLVSVTTVIFIFPPIGPLFSTFLGIPLNETERKMAGPTAPKSLVELGKDVANRNPVFILGLVLAIIAVVSAPTLQSIGGLITAMSIAVAVIGAALFHTYGLFKDVPEDKLVTVIDKIIRIVVVVVIGVMKLIELFQMLKQKIANYAARKGGGAAAAKGFVGDVMKRLGDKWNKFWDSMTGPFRSSKAGSSAAPKKFTLESISTALRELCTAVPEIIMALVGEDEDLREAAQIVKDMVDTTVSTYKEAKAIWDEGKELPKTPVLVLTLTEEEQRRLMAAVVRAGPNASIRVAHEYVPKAAPLAPQSIVAVADRRARVEQTDWTMYPSGLKMQEQVVTTARPPVSKPPAPASAKPVSPKLAPGKLPTLTARKLPSAAPAPSARQAR